MVQHPTYINATAQSPQKAGSGSTTDRSCWKRLPDDGLVAPKARVIAFRTLRTCLTMVSEVFLPEVESRDDLTLVGGPEEWQLTKTICWCRIVHPRPLVAAVII